LNVLISHTSFLFFRSVRVSSRTYFIVWHKAYIRCSVATPVATNNRPHRSEGATTISPGTQYPTLPARWGFHLFMPHIEPGTSHKLRTCSQKGFCQFAYISCCNIASFPFATRQVSFHPPHNHRQTVHQLH